METVFPIQELAICQRSVEQPSHTSQRILYLLEVTNRHRLEDEPVDVGFEVGQRQGPTALSASRLPVGRSRGLFRLTPSLLASVGWLRLCGCLGLPTKVACQSQRCPGLVHEGGA